MHCVPVLARSVSRLRRRCCRRRPCNPSGAFAPLWFGIDREVLAADKTGRNTGAYDAFRRLGGRCRCCGNARCGREHFSLQFYQIGARCEHARLVHDLTPVPACPWKASWRCSGPRPGEDRSAVSFSATRSRTRPMSPISSHPVLEDAARSIEYQAVFDSVIARIVEDGLSEMGIDMTCRGGNQSFYIRCTNRAHPAMPSSKPWTDYRRSLTSPF